MRIEVDRSLCESNGVCERIAPDLFEIDDDDRLVIKVSEISAERVGDAGVAVVRCPKQALRLV